MKTNTLKQRLTIYEIMNYTFIIFNELSYFKKHMVTTSITYILLKYPGGNCI